MDKRSSWEKLLLFRNLYGTFIHYVKECENVAAEFGQDVDIDKRMKPARQCFIEMMRAMDLEVTCSGAAISKSPCLFVGNHTSYLDVPVLYSQAAPSLVARYDLRYWPIVGRGAQAIDTIFIKRGKQGPRKEKVKKAIVEDIKRGKSVGVFPEGGTSLGGMSWKLGALALAQENGIPVQAFRIRYSPARVCAYIDDDSFVSHLWKLLSYKKLKVEIEFQSPFLVTDFVQDTRRLEKWSQFVDAESQRELLGANALATS